MGKMKLETPKTHKTRVEDQSDACYLRVYEPVEIDLSPDVLHKIQSFMASIANRKPSCRRDHVKLAGITSRWLVDNKHVPSENEWGEDTYLSLLDKVKDIAKSFLEKLDQKEITDVPQ